MSRPRNFDETVALDQAMRLFWAQGYEGTSLEDLTAALGIAKPSLYAAFGNKRALFDRALERYAGAARERIERALAAPRAIDAAREVLRIYVDVPDDAPPGCMLVQGALVCSPASQDVQRAVAELRGQGIHLLEKRLIRAHKEGDLPPDARPGDLARYVFTVAQGLAVQAVGGMTATQRRRVAELALRAWPTR